MDRNSAVGALNVSGAWSLSARRAWIEITVISWPPRLKTSLSARRAWIEIRWQREASCYDGSLSARRAWIEIINSRLAYVFAAGSLSARRAWIEIIRHGGLIFTHPVALRKESVDRNFHVRNPTTALPRSLSARRAWIEICAPGALVRCAGRRSPQGERG